MPFMSDFFESMKFFSQDYLTSSVMALALIIVGFFAILFVTKLVRKILKSVIKLNHYFAMFTGRDKPFFDLESVICKVLFFGLLFSLLYVSAQVAGFEPLIYMLGKFLTGLIAVLTLVLNAVIPIALALVFSFAAMQGVRWIGKKTKLDEKFGNQFEDKNSIKFSLTKSLSDVAYGLVFLYFVPEILNGIGLDDRLSNPITKMFEEVVAFVPRLFVAAVIIFLGWFVAKIIRQTVETLLVSLGIDNITSRIFGNNVLGNLKISKLASTILYVVILMMASIQALKKLSLNEITAPLQDLIQTAFDLIPALLFSGILLAFAAYIGGIISKFVSNALKDMGFDNVYSKIGLGDINTGAKTPSDIVGHLTFAIIFVMALLQSLETLNLNGLYEILQSLINQFVNILIGVVIFGIGLFVAKLVAEWITGTVKTASSNFLSLMAKIVIIVITGTMALQQIGIADEIVTIAFSLGLGSVALGFAIAIGLGAKDTAGEVVKDFMRKFKG